MEISCHQKQLSDVAVSHQVAAGVLTVGLCRFLNMTLNLVWTSPGITGVKVMGTLMELKGPISPSVTCVRRGGTLGSPRG